MEIGDKITIEKGKKFTAPEQGTYAAQVILYGPGEIMARFIFSIKTWIHAVLLPDDKGSIFDAVNWMDEGDTVYLECLNGQWKPYSKFTVTALSFEPPQPLIKDSYQ